MEQAEFGPATPPSAWESLVIRSLKAWELIDHAQSLFADEAAFLSRCTSLDDFWEASTKESVLFWFFQSREAFLSQKEVTKWSSDRLDDYILLPAFNNHVALDGCGFLSPFGRTASNDAGKYSLRLAQEHEKTDNSHPWSYIWVERTCMPQPPRSRTEEAYFMQTLQTMPDMMRNCGFCWLYPPLEPRMWILYQVAECILTGLGGYPATPDIESYVTHVVEMVHNGVRLTLDKYGYRCTYDRDRECLISWLEMMVLLKKLVPDIMRQLMFHLAWVPEDAMVGRSYNNGTRVEVLRLEGVVMLNGKRYTFTPFPRWQVTFHVFRGVDQRLTSDRKAEDLMERRRPFLYRGSRQQQDMSKCWQR